MSLSQILIAEDENIVALDIQEALKGAQYDVLGIVSSGRDAVKTASERKPDLVLMDIRLKGEVDGVQAATQIREKYDIPVIYLTAYSDENTLQRAKLTEPYGYLLKPFEKEALHTTIEMALHKHKTERELKESRRWLAAILRGIGDAVVATDAHGRITFMNPVAENLTGWPSAEAQGRLWIELLRFGEDQEGLGKAFVEGRAVELSPRAALSSREGAERPVHGGLAPTLDEKGRLTGFVFAFRDITSRRRLEEALERSNHDLEDRVRERTETLRESETRFRSIADSTPDGVLVADHEGNILYVNRSVQTLFGHPEKGLTGQSVMMLLPPKSQEPLKEAIARLKAGEKFRQMTEIFGLDRAGREFPIEMSVSTWTSGEKRFYAAILRDVSERRQAEASLQFQAGVLSQVKDAVVVVDPQGRVVYWNRGAERLYGYKIMQVIGSEPSALFNGDPWVPAEFQPQLEEVLSKGEVWHGEALHRTRGGQPVWVEMSVGVMRDEEGVSIGRLMALRDVSERKKLQTLLLHAERLAAMGQMAAGIAHELKTPLGVIFGFADVLTQKKPEEMGRMHESVETIKRQVVRCTHLVDNLLSFSRKHVPVDGLQAVEVNGMLAAALALVDPHRMVKSVAVLRETAPHALWVRGSREMLEQVVVNLSLNAIDAMSQGGTLTLGSRRVEKDGAPFVSIHVRDTGPGLSPDLRGRLFEPFFTTKDPSRGTGLGLWLSREIVTGFGGTISCESEPGKGATFSILLPEINPPEGGGAKEADREER